MHYVLTDYLLAFLQATEYGIQTFFINNFIVYGANELFFRMLFYLFHLTTCKECVWTVT